MNIRMTLSAVALGTMTLAGCGTMNTPAAPAVPPAPISGNTPSDVSPRPGLADATGPAVARGAEATTIPGVDAYDPTPDSMVGMGQAAGAPPVSGNTPNNLVRPGLADATGSSVAAGAEATTIPGVDAMDRTADDKSMMMVKDDGMMMADDAMDADDAAMSACFAAGGQVVNWVGDPSGAEMACQREDGLIYRLADAQYYQ